LLEALFHQKDVEKEITQQLFQASPLSNAIQLFVVAFFYVMFPLQLEPLYFEPWAVVMSLILLSRLALFALYKKFQHILQVHNWFRIFVGLTFLSGLAWAVFASLYLYLDTADLRSLIIIVICGIMAAAVAVLMSSMQAFLINTLPQIFALELVLLISDNPSASYLSLTIFIYYFLLVSLSQKTSANFSKMTLLEHRNKGLIDKLSKEVSQREFTIYARTKSLQVANDRLQTSQARLNSIIEYSPVGIMYFDKHSVVLSANRQLEEILGAKRDKFLGFNLLTNVTDENMAEAIKSALNGDKGSFHGPYSSAIADYSVYLHAEFVPIFSDETGDIVGGLGVYENISSQQETLEKLNYQASHDGLTGLLNRYEFERRMQLFVDDAQQNATRHVLCFLDLDQFKIVNDTCGHRAGDELLAQLAKEIQLKIYDRDTLARVGGDEFAVLLENCDCDDALTTAEALRDTVERYQFIWDGRVFSVGVSIGLTEINQTTINVSEAFIQADAACYVAKDLGRNRVHIHRDDDEQLAKQYGDFKWVGEIQTALLENKLVLYAQPIVDLHDERAGKIFEILLRMSGENGKTFPPGAFLPAAERYGLANKIDRWVIEHAFKWLLINQEQLSDLDHIAINLSGNSLSDLELLNFIADEINHRHVPAAKIKFEITETAAISNLNDAQHFMSELRVLGCRFALDDFGSGVSSFGYLKSLQVDTLKIDGVFVKDIVEDKVDAAMVKSINEVGHVMGMKTVAEFVENNDIKQLLKSMNVDYAQGYGIGMPIPLEQIELS